MSLLEQASASESWDFRVPVGLTVEPSGRPGDAAEGDVILSFPLSRRRPRSLRLTPTEWELLREISRGSSNTAIAASRRVSVRTVANQLAHLFRKLGVHSRLDAMLMAGHWTSRESHEDAERGA